MMPNQERVLHGLDSCGFHYGIPNICEVTECPYRDDKCGCVHELAHDAGLLISELLKAQEPHLITKADFADNPMIDDGGYLPAWVEFNREKYGDFFEEDADGWGCVNINKVGNDMARYWTAKPSLKQMEATPWE